MNRKYGLAELAGLILLCIYFISPGILFTSHNTPAKSIDTTQYCGAWYKLETVFSFYENIKQEGGWPIIPKEILSKKETNSHLMLLNKRLWITGDLDPLQDSSGFVLQQGLKHFQARHGLDSTGVLDKQTLDALNVPVEKRLDQIKVNLERWKNVPDSLGDNYIFVNTADFKLEVVDQGKTMLKMKVIVGKPYRKTPVFHATLTYLVINPSWVIPFSIYQKDILPVIRKDSAYLRKKRIHVYDLSVKGAKKEADPDTINWTDVPEKDFRYELVQEPGPDNPLGTIKFMFPNEYKVYMHDTPAKQLFEESEPAYSSGCLRIADAVAMACYLLKNKKSWDKEKIMNVINSGKTLIVPLDFPMEVYIYYFTAWVDESGLLQFRKDIYGRDVPSTSSL